MPHNGVAPLARRSQSAREGYANQPGFVALIVGLVAIAWLALLWWGQSPYARFLDHEELEHISLLHDPEALLFVGGWTLMTVAMMLPTTLPLLTVFRSVTGRRADRRQLLALVVGGYLAVWVTFGLVIHAGDELLHRFAHDVAWLEQNPWAVGAAIFALAGAYQFSSIKYRCLEQCRSPLMFVTRHWQGRNEPIQALALGIHHGMFCLGCCWTLMLLMFAVGVGNPGWMLLLGAVMALEKNAPWASRISQPLGAILLGASVVVIAASV